MKCCVRGCPQNHLGSTKGFFTFPRDKNLQKQWILFSGIKDVANLNKYRVCADHFKDDEIVGRIQCDLGIPRVLKLRKGTVPTIRPTDLLEKESSRWQRMAIRERRQLVESLLNSNSEKGSEEEDELDETDEDEEEIITNLEVDPLTEPDNYEENNLKVESPTDLNDNLEPTEEVAFSLKSNGFTRNILNYRVVLASNHSSVEISNPESEKNLIIAVGQEILDLNAPKKELLYKRDILQNQVKILKKLLRERQIEFSKSVQKYKKDIEMIKTALKSTEKTLWTIKSL